MPGLTLDFVREDLRGRAAYAEGAGIYRVLPAAVARPGRLDELKAVLVWARERGMPVTARGAGSAMGGGNVGSGLVLDLTALGERRVTVDPGTRIARVAPGATGSEVNDAAQPHRLRLPPDPSSVRFATSGGMVSTNAAGARSYRFGSVRPWVDGLDLLTVDGDVLSLDRRRPPPDAPAVRRFARDVAPRIRSARANIRERFPRTRKNSSGYALDAWLDSGDLVDLVVGSEGTLGIVTEIRWRLGPAPDARGGLRVAVLDDERLMAALDVIRHSGPVAIEVLDRTFLRFVEQSLSPSTRELARRASALLLVEYEGGPAAVQQALAVTKARLGAVAYEASAGFGSAALEVLWAIRHAASPLLAHLGEQRRSLQVIEDGCVPVERLAEYLAMLRVIPERHGVGIVVFGHAGDGHLHANLLPDVTEPGWERRVAAIFAEVSAAQLALGGTPSGEHGTGRLRAGLLERQYGTEIMELFRAVKLAFDPGSLLNPGIIVPSRESGSPLSHLKVGLEAVRLPEDLELALREIECSGSWDVDRFAMADSPSVRPPVGPT